MQIKTEFNVFNEDDFIQTSDGGMQEATVTITLCEYRNLIQSLTRYEFEIDKLHTEKAEAMQKNDALQKIILEHWPQLREKICAAFDEIFGVPREVANEEE